MQVRDLYSACVGFIAACGLMALQRYLVEPTMAVAAALIASAASFAIAVACYATATIAHPPAPQHDRLSRTADIAQRSSSVQPEARPSRAKRENANQRNTTARA